MPLQQIQNMQESEQETSPEHDNGPMNSENAKTSDAEKPRVWLWIAIALIVFLAASAGIYFWIFK